MAEKEQRSSGRIKRTMFDSTARAGELFTSPWKRNARLGRTAATAYSQLVDFLTQDIDVQVTMAPVSFREVDTQKSDESAKLKRLIRRSTDVLATASTVFPFDLFPDTVSIDRTKITIVKRSFFWSEQVMSIRIEDVLNVATTVGPFFGSLTIASRVMSSEDHFRINFFWRRDAIYLKHIIQGYVIARHNKIKTSHLPKDELVSTLAELGHDKSS